MLQAAVTGCFDFSDVTPFYNFRLRLVLDELKRMNIVRLAENAALHCAIIASTASGENRTTNMNRLDHNMKILGRYLRQSDIENSEENDPVLEEWKKRNNDGQRQPNAPGSE